MPGHPLRTLLLSAVLALPSTLPAEGASAAPPHQPQVRLARLSSLSPLTRNFEDRWSARAVTRAPVRREPAIRFPVPGHRGYGEAAARFGNDRGSHVHAGQDVFAPVGTPLLAVADAVVVEEGGGDARGNYLVLYDRGRRRSYAYFHMRDRARFRRGERVRAGERVGAVGCTGRCFGPHLHFEIRLGRGGQGRATDPLPLLRRLERARS